MPMTQALLKSRQSKNERLMPVEPNVKSDKTSKLFNVGVTDVTKTEKSTDPTCYAWSFNGERSCKHSASRYSLRMKLPALDAAGGGSAFRSDASGFAFGMTWAAPQGSHWLSTSGLGRERCEHEQFIAGRQISQDHKTGLMVLRPAPADRQKGACGSRLQLVKRCHAKPMEARSERIQDRRTDRGACESRRCSRYRQKYL